eukprot:SAG11_NODE_3327_length_2521_cov_20.966969_1_plen_125_part_00
MADRPSIGAPLLVRHWRSTFIRERWGANRTAPRRGGEEPPEPVRRLGGTTGAERYSALERAAEAERAEPSKSAPRPLKARAPAEVTFGVRSPPRRALGHGRRKVAERGVHLQSVDELGTDLVPR